MTGAGGEREFAVTPNSVTARGGKGRHLVKRGGIAGLSPREVTFVRLEASESSPGDDPGAAPSEGGIELPKAEGA